MISVKKKKYRFCPFFSAENKAVSYIFKYTYIFSCKDANIITSNAGRKGGSRQVGYLHVKC